MQYVLVIHQSSEQFDARTTDTDDPDVLAWRRYYRSLVNAGIYIGGRPLEAVSQAAVVRVRAGKPQIQDGPYAETKEHLGGFIVLELPSMEDAVHWAARCPAAVSGAVEVRPVAGDLHETITG